MTISLNAGSLSSDELEDRKDLAPPTATPLGDPMRTRSRRIFTSDDDRIVSGTWECEPGESAWDFADRGEVIHVLSGRMTCAEKDGTTTEVGPGTTTVFPVGWQGTWTIHETLRKVFVIYR
ncbi:cupin domain-containing protein [Streptomyces sp. NPDC057623]|uniref:cupin domain-containing protein n=1 Tax=Streptomyces sp. NPDC057623 TaxID=3346187 RepID=UPI0036C09580